MALSKPEQRAGASKGGFLTPRGRTSLNVHSTRLRYLRRWAKPKGFGNNASLRNFASRQALGPLSVDLSLDVGSFEEMSANPLLISAKALSFDPIRGQSSVYFLRLKSGALYIGSHLGPGPRDGLWFGLVRKTGLSVRLLRTSVEVTVLVIGFFLGGTVGVGTVLYALSIGPIVQFFLPRVQAKLSRPNF